MLNAFYAPLASGLLIGLSAVLLLALGDSGALVFVASMLAGMWIVARWESRGQAPSIDVSVFTRPPDPRRQRR